MHNHYKIYYKYFLHLWLINHTRNLKKICRVLTDTFKASLISVNLETIELKVRSSLDLFFQTHFFLFFCNGKYDRDDHLYVIDCCAKIAKKYVIALLPGRRILTYITLSATSHYRICSCSQQAAFGENYEWRVNVGTNISLSPISTVGKRGAETGISLLDNAPNYLVGFIIQKRYKSLKI